MPGSGANRIERSAASTDTAASASHTRSMRFVPHRILRGLVGRSRLSIFIVPKELPAEIFEVPNANCSVVHRKLRCLP